ncbi:S1C family serine protease [Frankia sp. AgB32]|uniref:S1C family serine protease n=1 Tax=Frankia sp. AgB32 TaxID=631119 RepID=UPI00200DB8EF|nr:trypsin-like peptidase domain-containing protein [Frankia sp. AgB32]MCK9893737.1 trypsin-like peptidase domain-containing protein [Frankia sp. AgB32]
MLLDVADGDVGDRGRDGSDRNGSTGVAPTDDAAGAGWLVPRRPSVPPPGEGGDRTRTAQQGPRHGRHSGRSGGVGAPVTAEGPERTGRGGGRAWSLRASAERVAPAMLGRSAASEGPASRVERPASAARGVESRSAHSGSSPSGGPSAGSAAGVSEVAGRLGGRDATADADRVYRARRGGGTVTMLRPGGSGRSVDGGAEGSVAVDPFLDLDGDRAHDAGSSAAGDRRQTPGRAVAGLTGRPVQLGWRVLLACLLTAALLGGGVGGLFVSITTGDTTVQPVKTLGVGDPAPVTDRRSVAAIAAAALPTVVTIDVGDAGGDGGTGSGVIIGSDGFILTNNHVIAPAVASGSPISVRLYQEFGQIPAQLVGRDPQTDLAVLRITTTSHLPAATLGQSGSLVVGAPVVAIGAPLGLSGTVTTGVVSALDRNPTVPAGEGVDPTVLIGAIQIDAAINPGNSGGPLLDALGQVVGINAAIAAVPGHEDQTQSGSIGVGFAIPIDFARSVAQEIISTGRATHPYVGASSATITAGEAAATGGVAGARIVATVPDGPAARAGLRPGDVVTRIDTSTIRGTNDLIVAARLHRVGDRVSVTYVRQGATETAQMTLQEQQG